MSVHPLIAEDELICLREEVRRLQVVNASLTTALTSSRYAKELERFHVLDGLKDDLCPSCGSPVQVVEGPRYQGELSAHGTPIGPATVRLFPRYR